MKYPKELRKDGIILDRAQQPYKAGDRFRVKNNVQILLSPKTSFKGNKDFTEMPCNQDLAEMQTDLT